MGDAHARRKATGSSRSKARCVFSPPINSSTSKCSARHSSRIAREAAAPSSPKKSTSACKKLRRVIQSSQSQNASLPGTGCPSARRDILQNANNLGRAADHGQAFALGADHSESRSSLPGKRRPSPYSGLRKCGAVALLRETALLRAETRVSSFSAIMLVLLLAAAHCQGPGFDAPHQLAVVTLNSV